MKNIKNEKGAITILVLVSVLFMVSFLLSSYIIVANKVQGQKEIIAQTKNLYENYNIEDIYNSFFGKNIIPISNEEQLLAIGTGVDKIIGGKYYSFANNENTIYTLMNNIEINAYEKNGEENYYWLPIGEREDLLAKFDGKGNSITVNYKDNENDIYSIEYNNDNNYSEQEYQINVNPRLISENGSIIGDAKILIAREGEEFNEISTGETQVSVKRLTSMQVKATSDFYKDSGIATIYIENPDKIQDYNLVLGKYTFTIIPSPSNAIVTINGERRTTISASRGEEITWQVELDGYVTRNGNHILQSDETINIALKEKYTFTIIANPSDAKVTINGITTNSIKLGENETATWKVERNYYYTQSGTYTMKTSNYQQTCTLTKKPSNTLTLNPSSVTESSTGDFKVAGSKANKGVDADTGTYARATGDAYLEWNFNNFAEIDNNAKIESITVNYRIGAAWKMGASVLIKAGSTTCLNKNYSEVYSNLVSGSQKYTDTATTLPSASELKKGVTLRVKKGNTSNSYHFRWYGATIEVKYTNP